MFPMFVALFASLGGPQPPMEPGGASLHPKSPPPKPAPVAAKPSDPKPPWDDTEVPKGYTPFPGVWLGLPYGWPSAPRTESHQSAHDTAECCPPYAFDARPYVAAVDKDDEDCASKEDKANCLRISFLQPAHFPDTRYDLGGLPFEADGVIIHEGMSFVINENGGYRVRMTVTAPDTAITLRLRLQIISDAPVPPQTVGFNPIDGGAPVLIDGKEIPPVRPDFSIPMPYQAGRIEPRVGFHPTVNLPPIQWVGIAETNPAALQRGTNDALMSRNIQVSGQSPALKQWMAHRIKVGEAGPGKGILGVSRQGTARIGSRPAR